MTGQRVLLIYTGGTIGMVQDPTSQTLVPVDFDHLSRQVPELRNFDLHLEAQAFHPPLDSSDMLPATWQDIAARIFEAYDRFDGFVVLHGSDTMAYTASALSFMLQGIGKPVVLTGSQLPIGVIRTDGKENLITAIEIASAYHNGVAVVPEVSVYFEYRLFRGNRVVKYHSEHFDAFKSPNYPPLAEAGIHLDFKNEYIMKPLGNLRYKPKMESGVGVVTLFPGMSLDWLQRCLGDPSLRALILQTYGAGNAPRDPAFLGILEKAIERGLTVVNVSQCLAGTVEQGRYETSRRLQEMGVISGGDITLEAAITKLMHLLGNSSQGQSLSEAFLNPIVGERSH